jgi:hypothetical protein
MVATGIDTIFTYVSCLADSKLSATIMPIQFIRW